MTNVHAIRVGIAFDGERFLPDGATVLVEGPRIVAVESARSVLPADVPVTAYAGTLLPGLVDAHVHLVADATMGSLERAGSLPVGELDAVVRQSLAQQAAAGVTTVRDLGDTRFFTLHHRDVRRPGEPRIVAAGPPITVPGGHCHFLGGAVSGPEAIREAVAERVRRGVDVVKVMASGGLLTPGSDSFGVQFSDEDLLLLVAESHAAGLPVVAHAHSLAAAWQALRVGVDGIEHFSCMSEQGVHMPEQLLAEVAARRVVVDLTLGNDPAVMAAMGAPPPTVKVLLDRLGIPWERFREQRIQTVEPLLRHGVAQVAGVDAGAAPPKAHGNLWFVVSDLVEGGYPLEQALAAATSAGARACGLGGVTGALRPGLDADLLVVPGDVRRDLPTLGRPTAVWMRGVPLQLPRPEVQSASGDSSA